jgi:hypothetical protein
MSGSGGAINVKGRWAAAGWLEGLKRVGFVGPLSDDEDHTRTFVSRLDRPHG